LNAVVFSIRNLVKVYSGITILDHLSFDVYARQPMLVQGPSGCGKTTLLRCMCFLEPIQGGSIEFCGELRLGPNHGPPSLSRENRKRISMVFQNLYLWNHLTVLENVSLPLMIAGETKADAVSRAASMLEKLGIPDTIAQLPTSLSGGQKQRVAIARALVHSPDAMLLDEITANLDAKTASLVFNAIEHVVEDGIAVLTVSHSDKVPSFLQADRLVYVNGQWEMNP